MFFSPIIHNLRSSLRRISTVRTMSTAPTFKPFNLALVQLGQVTADKAANLSHARDMILKAAQAEGAGDSLKPSYSGSLKPDLVVLPVCVSLAQVIFSSSRAEHRNVSTHPMDLYIFRSTLRP